MADQAAALVTVPEEVAQQQSRIVRQAEGLILQNLEDYEASTAFLKLLDDALVLADNLFDKNIKNWNRGHKDAVTQKKDFVAPFERAMQIAKYKRVEFRSIAERNRQKAEAEERERARLAQAADLAQHAQTLEQAGDPSAAQAVREFAETAPAPVVIVRSEISRGGGTRITPQWKFRIIDEVLIPRQFLIPDEKAIGVHVRSLKEKALIPGIEFYADEGESIL